MLVVTVPTERLGDADPPRPACSPPQQIAAIAERARPGNGAGVLEYVRDLERAFAIPILHVTEYPGMSADELREHLGSFHPPQGYVRLNQHPALPAVCEKGAAETPVRKMPVHHR